MVKILWVDDEVELLKPHVLFLQQKGYEVDTWIKVGGFRQKRVTA